MARYEIDHEGKIVEAETELCKDREKMLDQLFTQFGWSYETVEKQSGCYTLQLKDPNDNTRVINVYTANLRNESRSPYEKKGQTNLLDDPSKRDKDNTIILGIYVYKENDPAKDAIFVGFPVANRGVNSSMRGAHVNKLLVEAKTKGFVYDKELKIVGFRAEFIFYYLDNYKKLHYGTGEPAELETENIQVDRVSDGKNIILYGVPGCGKSHEIKTKYCDDKEFMERVVFHPDYTYSDFIGQILPKTDGETISYPFTAGPFTVILEKAIHHPENMYYLVIEEINRGNAPAIFGEVFQLLDRENGESEYGINNFDIAKYIYGDGNEEEEIKIPSNLTILATMNTADQNVFTLDTAFKRRWTLRSIKNDIAGCDHAGTYIEGTKITWRYFAEKINDTIIDINDGSLSSEDTRLGAYFVKEADLKDRKIFAEKVLMYLWNDAFKYDRDKIFKSEYKTLEELLDAFCDSGFAVFNSQLEFDETLDVSSSRKGQDVYLQGKNEELVKLYASIRDEVLKKVSNSYIYTVSSEQYIVFGSDDNKKNSFADIKIYKNKILFSIEKPRKEEYQTVGSEIRKDGHHNHYFEIIVTGENDLETVIAAIVDSYEQLKEAN